MSRERSSWAGPLAVVLLVLPVCAGSGLGVIFPQSERLVAPLTCGPHVVSEVEVSDDGRGRGGHDRTLVCIGDDGTRTPVSPLVSRTWMLAGSACACWAPAALAFVAWGLRARPTLR